MPQGRIAVVGAGLMGHGIAQVFALAGHDVAITDSFTGNLDTVKARITANLRDLGDDETAVERVRPVAELAEAVRDADYVVEAISEDLPLKQKLFAEIEKQFVPAPFWPATRRSFRSPRSWGLCASVRARSARIGGTRLTWFRWSR